MWQPPRADSLGSYIRLHWRGDLSLPKSYWLNCFLLSWALQLASAFALARLDIAAAPPLAGLVALYWVLLFVLTVWQLVGTWRSAGRHAERGGGRGWGAFARVALFVGALVAAANFINVGIPQIDEFTRIALGTDDTADFHLDVSADGTVLRIQGGIGFGLAGELERHLDGNPRVHTVEFWSIGGRVVEARRVAGLILARRLDTLVREECNSACTLAFMAGNARIVGIRAVLGFHRYAFPGMPERELASLTAEDRVFLRRRGVPVYFIERIYATPSDELWVPRRGELLDAHVATGVEITAEDEHEFLGGLESSPLYAALRDVEPAVYGRIVEHALAGLRRDELGGLRAAAMPLIHPVYRRHLPRASDTAVAETWSVIIEQGRTLRDVHPDLCFAYFEPGSARGVDPVPHLSPESMRREQEAMAQVIRSGGTQPRPVPAPEEVREELRIVYDAVARRLGERAPLADQPPDTAEARAARCDMTIYMAEEVIALPASRAPTVMRALAANQ